MFPFTLPGAQFLGFYVMLATLILVAFWYYLNAGPQLAVRLSELTGDPYQIAHIRAGDEEVVRVAIVNLVDRGLLTLEAVGTLRTAKADAAEFVRRPLERAILKCCATPVAASAISNDGGVRAACGAYERELQRKGLLAGASNRTARFMVLVAVVGLLGGVGLARLFQAISRGQSNIEFLLMLGLLAVVPAVLIYRRMHRGTAAGRKALSSIETLLSRLKARADGIAPGGATNEALLLAAVFGLHVLPFAWIEQIFPRRRQSDSNGCGSSCGSSGCGGGGGGCGGCGGD